MINEMTQRMMGEVSPILEIDFKASRYLLDLEKTQQEEWEGRVIEIRQEVYIRRRKNPTKLDIEYEKLIIDQLGLCYLCSKRNVNEDMIERVLCFDHNHKTGKRRKLLCHFCNFALGFVNEDTALLGKMIAYLEEF